MRGIVSLVLLLSLITFRAATFEVAQSHPLANDDGSGTSDRPFKSMSKAAEKAATGATVIVHSGTYRERVVVTASGTAEKPIRFESAAGEYVLLTGADR